jgi:hypothetical protein
MKALLPLLFIAMPAFAEPLPENCAANGLSVMAGKLSKDYGETLAASMLNRKTGAIITLYGSLDTGTWTALSTFPDGVTCFEGEGVGFRAYPMGAPA